MDENGILTGSWKTHTDNLDLDLFDSDFILEGNLFIEKFLIYKNVIPNASALLIRKEELNILGTINTDNNLRYCGDWLLYFKIALNQEVSFHSQNLNNFRFHSKSVIAKVKENDIYSNSLYVLMQKKLIFFMKTLNPKNLKKIIEKSKLNINELYYLIAYYIKKKEVGLM
ncbi:hypothetical protein MCEGE10_01424 [Flavobacteriaceae bacterium]